MLKFHVDSFVFQKCFLLLSSVRTGFWIWNLLLSGLSQVSSCRFCLTLPLLPGGPPGVSQPRAVALVVWEPLPNRKDSHITPAIKYKVRCRSESQFSTECIMQVMYSIKSEKHISAIHHSFVEKALSKPCLTSSTMFLLRFDIFEIRPVRCL